MFSQVVFLHKTINIGFIFESFRAAGIRGIEAHMEAEHPGVAEEDWAYTVATQACQYDCHNTYSMMTTTIMMTDDKLDNDIFSCTVFVHCSFIS